MFDRSSLKSALVAASLVTQLAIASAIGLWIGNALDGWLGTGPWLLLAFTTIGFAAGLFRLFQATASLHDDDDAEHDPP